MKKAISVILFVLTILVVLVMIGGVIFGELELSQEYEELTASPGYSAVDLVGVWFGEIFLLFFVFIGSVVALIFSVINIKLAENRFIKRFSLIVTILMGLISFIAFFCIAGGV